MSTCRSLFTARIQIYICCLCAAVYLLCSGCVYTIGARLPLGYSRIYLEQFENRTAETFLGYEITKYLKRAIIERTSAALAHSPESAAAVKGVIARIGRDVFSKDSTGRIVSERLTVQVNVTVTPPSGRARTFSVIGAKVYTRSGTTVRRVMIQEACRDAARQIVHRLIQREAGTDV